MILCKENEQNVDISNNVNKSEKYAELKKPYSKWEHAPKPHLFKVLIQAKPTCRENLEKWFSLMSDG